MYGCSEVRKREEREGKEVREECLDQPHPVAGETRMSLQSKPRRSRQIFGKRKKESNVTETKGRMCFKI